MGWASLASAQTVRPTTEVWDFKNGLRIRGVPHDHLGGATPAGGQPIAEVDGSPSGTFTVLKFSNGTVTDNGDGTATILTGGTGSGGGLSPVNPQTNTYQVLASDFAQTKTIAVASGTFTITLVDTATQPPDGQFVTIVNYGDGVVSVVPSGQTLNGDTAALTLPASTAQNPATLRIVSDGTNYVASLAGGIAPFSKFTPIATNTFLGRQSAGTGATEPVPAADARMMLDVNNVDNTSDATKNAAPAVLTNKTVLPIIVIPTITADAITPDLDLGNMFILDAISADLTINCPIGTAPQPYNEQWIEFRFTSATPRALTWNASCYTEENGIVRPVATTGDGATIDRVKYVYNSTTTKYGVVASTVALTRGTTTLGSATTFTCNIQLASTCKMSMTGAAGTLTIANPTGTPQDGWKLQMNIRCTNAQTIAWDTKFVGSAGITLATANSCPADTTKWVMFGVEYSLDLDKYQLIATTQ
jgi:hypothetical protein